MKKYLFTILLLTSSLSYAEMQNPWELCKQELAKNSKDLVSKEAINACAEKKLKANEDALKNINASGRYLLT